MLARWFPSVAIVVAVCFTTAAGKMECDPPGSSPNRTIEDADQWTEGKYLPGDYIAFRCDEGFSPTTLPEVSCNADFEWDPLPLCQVTSCSLPQVEHGRVVGPNKGTWSWKEWVSLGCDPGYNLHPHSAANLQCVGSEQGDGDTSWDRAPPTCKPVLCTPIVNSDIENGYVSTSGNGSAKGQFVVGDNVTVTCHDGYVLQGNKTRTCLVEGTWSGTLQICDDRDSLCGPPGSPVGGRKYGTSYNWGDKVTFDCDPGRTMVGNAERTCLENGYWSGLQPLCIGKDEYTSPEQMSEAFGNIVHDLSKSTTVEDLRMLESYRHKSVMLGKQYMNSTYDEYGRSLNSLRTRHGLNLYFMIDTSASISKEELWFALNVTEKIVEQMTIGPREGETVVGLVAYSNTVWKKLAPQDAPNKEDVYRALREIRDQATGGGTAPTLALKMINEQFKIDAVTARGNNGHDIPRAVVMFTDGNANMGGDPLDLVNQMKADASIKTEFYVLGLGEANMDALKKIATTMTSEHLVKAEGRSASEVVKAFTRNENDFSACGRAGNHGLESETLVTSARAAAWPWMVGIYRLEEPYQSAWTARDVALNKQLEYYCGGSILTDRWVLTAAHCVDDTSTFLLKFGSISSDINDAPGEQLSIKILAKNVYRHHNYIAVPLQNDIALIELNAPLTFQEGVRRVCLPEPDSEDLYENGTPAVVTGWGWWNNTSPFERRTADLKQMTMKVYNRPLCEEKMKNSNRTGRLSDVSFCAGGIRDHNNQLMDPCPTDSGGPLVSTDLENKNIWRQTGIVSFGDEKKKCRLENGAGGYTKVSKFVEWINSMMNRA